MHNPAGLAILSDVQTCNNAFQKVELVGFGKLRLGVRVCFAVLTVVLMAPFYLSFSNEASVLLPIDYCAGSYSSSNLAESVVRLGDAEDDPINVSFRHIECS